MVGLAVIFLPFLFSLLHQSESAIGQSGSWLAFLPYSNNWIVGMILPSLGISIASIVLLSGPVRIRAMRLLNGGPYLSLMALMFFVWLFVTVEVGLRSLSSKHTPSPLHVGMNYIGYRGPVISIIKPEDTHYIAAIGGSTTYGNGVDWWEAWPAYFEEHLNVYVNTNDHHSFRVANLGLEGAGLDCGIRRFRHFSKMYKFDVLVIHAGYNGIGDWCQLWLPINTKLRDVSLLIHVVMEFLEGQTSYINMMESINRVVVTIDKNTDANEATEDFVQMYVEFVADVLRNGTKVVAILQPSPASQLAGSEISDASTSDDLMQRLALRGDILGSSLIKRFGNFDEFILVDLHAVDIDQYRADSIHLMPEGNRYISEIIASKLLDSYDK
ncbi:MAG: hypothetical protein CL606_04210 [Anaerolineaceae bacterium]|nr:hypothetical protein [Anaerolineaceae bacterium]